jgi:hypothetical protein
MKECGIKDKGMLSELSFMQMEANIKALGISISSMDLLSL